ncbi:histidine phosphatase family protein [Litoribacter ruber]|uniref:SixA phosphatase family protein n=1 Tax=Litoribacter ruber TaxID=702568 RepID=UPI001BD9F2E2|nr:histidine phosphatase family protein [Litoribacter ruber]MBT0811928.1 histidine phosphatase family protein [Litoribacter ruber]
MKRFLICRHAKSSWDKPFLADHKRPLAPRGLRNAKDMAQRLVAKKIFPDMIISSDAERAKHTAGIFADILGIGKNHFKLTSELYHASPTEILKYIRKTPNTVDTLFIFGHNPGLTDLVVELGEDLENLPTTGVFGFTFNVEDWGDVGKKNAKFWMHDYPKNPEAQN